MTPTEFIFEFGNGRKEKTSASVRFKPRGAHARGICTCGNLPWVRSYSDDLEDRRHFKASAIILQLEGFENISRGVLISYLVEKMESCIAITSRRRTPGRWNEFTMEDNNYCAGESDDQERSHTTSEGFHCQSHSASFEWGIPFLVVGFASRPIRNVWSNL